MMKIGVVTPEFPPLIGGTSHHAFGLARTLAKTDQITVYTSAVLAPTTDRQYRFDVHPVLKKELSADAIQLAAAEVDVWVLLNAGYAPLSLTLKAPSFVYCHGNDFLNPWITRDGIFFSPAARWVNYLLARTPVLWRHEPAAQSWMHRHYMRRHIAKGLNRACNVFVNSHYTAKRLRDAIPSYSRPVTVSYPGLDPELLADDETIAKRLTPSTDTLRLLTVTRLESHSRNKAVDEVLYAVAELGDVALSLTIVGDGDDRGRLQNLSHALRIDHRVIFAGEVTGRSLLRYIDDADLFVLVSDDSFGMVYVEAAARGLPSIARAKTQECDAFVPGETAFAIPSAKPSVVAAEIRRFQRERQCFDPFRIRDFARRFVWPEVGAAFRAELLRRL